MNNNLTDWKESDYLKFVPPEITITCDIEFAPGDRERFMQAWEDLMIKNRHVEVRIIE